MIKRIAAFAGLPLLSSLASFILLPIVARVGGAPVWTALALGQAIGAIAAIVVGLGWSLTGPAAVASSSDETVRRRHYAVSFATRSLALLGTIPLMFVALTLAGNPANFWLAFLMACAQAASGLTPAWYCIATGQPGRIAKYDVIPRMVATLGVIPFLLATGHVVVYPAALLVLGLTGTLFFNAHHTQRDDFQGLSIARIIREIWALRTGAGVTLAAGSYASTPIIIVQFMAASGGLAAFVSAEKLYRIGLLATAALGNSLQGWVSDFAGDHARRRKYSLIALSGLGLMGWLLLAVAGPWATALLFSEALTADFWTCFWFGLSFLLVCVTSSTGAHWLVPAKRMRTVLSSTVSGAVVGVPAMIILTGLFGGQGGALGLALGEIVVTAIQMRVVLHLLREPESDSASKQAAS
ncbi:O-antigen/teichoic acid export membrane protein [Pseudarthrobacter siccitolerans]|uniref:O-antigen/teichoic acid export membrane protein n=1 Tax=Pseudarthrobacter siccitolerans TaxID=861266 RepID=A0ABU0PHN3_9MICC|nr:polysaccharide biosynthesis C-terminal domain-containing protein [Pseudarthrobacter siccitolerans]MDQ0673458.1 O-antigen/teichoic acid export membrane protein [Pseudarthrobacter siccitolerans]